MKKKGDTIKKYLIFSESFSESAFILKSASMLSVLIFFATAFYHFFYMDETITLFLN